MGLAGWTVQKRVSDTKLTFEWSSRTACCKISLSGCPTGQTHTGTIMVWSNPLLCLGIRHTLIKFEMAASSSASSLWRYVGCVPEHYLILHFNLSLQFATWWLLLAAQPIHKRLRKRKSLFSLEVFLQKSVQSSNLCITKQTLRQTIWTRVLWFTRSSGVCYHHP